MKASKTKYLEGFLLASLSTSAWEGGCLETVKKERICGLHFYVQKVTETVDLVLLHCQIARKIILHLVFWLFAVSCNL